MSDRKIKYKYNGMGITISGHSGTYDHLPIPSKIDGRPVTRIGTGAFSHCQSLNSVIIPCTVNIIGRNAFAHCPNLQEVNIPDGVRNIDRSAFEGCSSLEKVNIPDRVYRIPESMFYNCTSLKDIFISNINDITIGDHAFYGCDSLDKTLKDQIESINSHAFMPREIEDDLVDNELDFLLG